MYRLDVGNVKESEGVPVLELHVVDDRLIPIYTVYLSPFR